MPAGYDWIFWTVGGVVGALSLWLLYWSLLHDRSHGRRRCPKCWYDMSGTPESRTCSECGHVARRERRLFRTRRRWGLTACAILIGLAAALLSRWPALQRDGMAGWLPTTALVVALPWLDDPQHETTWKTNALRVLLDDRIDVRNTNPSAVDLWDWQWRAIISYALQPKTGNRRLSNNWHLDVLQVALCRGAAHRVGMDSALWRLHPRINVQVPRDWPVDVPIPIAVTYDAMLPCLVNCNVEITDAGNSQPLPLMIRASTGMSNKIEGNLILPVGEERPIRIECRTSLELVLANPAGDVVQLPLISQSSQHEIFVFGRLQDWIKPDTDQVLAERIQSGFELRFFYPNMIQVAVEGLLDDLDNMGSFARLELFRQNELVYEGMSDFKVGGCQFATESYDGLCATFVDDRFASFGAAGPTPESSESWRFRFSIDPLSMLVANPGGEHSYWPGAIEAPIDWQDFRKGKPIRATFQND